MKRILVCLFVVFSMLFAPVVHAREFSCTDSGRIAGDHTPQHEKQDDGKFSGAGHYCGHHHAADRAPLSAGHSPVMTSPAFIHAALADLVSVIVGPLLEPPSLS